MNSAAACRDTDQQGGSHHSTRLSRPHSQCTHALNTQGHSCLVALVAANIHSYVEFPTEISGCKWSCWAGRCCCGCLFGVSLGGGKEWQPSSRCPVGRLGLYHFASSLLSGCSLWTMVVAEVPCSWRIQLPSGGKPRHSGCITDPQRGAEKEGWCGEWVEARDKQQTTTSALPCSINLVEEASSLPLFGAYLLPWYSGSGSGDKSFIVT